MGRGAQEGGDAPLQWASCSQVRASISGPSSPLRAVVPRPGPPTSVGGSDLLRRMAGGFCAFWQRRLVRLRLQIRAAVWFWDGRGRCVLAASKLVGGGDDKVGTLLPPAWQGG